MREIDRGIGGVHGGATDSSSVARAVASTDTVVAKPGRPDFPSGPARRERR